MEFSFVPPGEVIGLPCTLNRFCLSMMCQCSVTNNGGSEYRARHRRGYPIPKCIFRTGRDEIDIFQN